MSAKLQLKHGRYFYLQRKADRRGYRWIGLSHDKAEAEQQRARIEAGESLAVVVPEQGPPQAWLAAAIVLLHRRTRDRATTDDILFLLTREDLIELGESTNWRCAITGIAFSKDRLNGAHARAFAPSVDRIDSRKGYVRENCRLVCVAVNYAMNEWGIEIFHQLAKAYCRRQGLLKQAPKLVKEADCRHFSDGQSNHQ